MRDQDPPFQTLFMWWEFPINEFLDKTRRGWSRDAIINNF